MCPDDLPNPLMSFCIPLLPVCPPFFFHIFFSVIPLQPDEPTETAKDTPAHPLRHCGKPHFSYFLLPQLLTNLSNMDTMASFAYTHTLDLLNNSQPSYGFENSNTEEPCTSNLDHFVHEHRPETTPLVENFAGNELEPWHESETLTCTLSEEDLLELDSFGFHDSGDSASLDPWYEAFTKGYDLRPELQPGNLPLEILPDPGTAEWLMPLEDNSADTRTSISFPVTPGNSYQPTPNLTECSTPVSLSTSNGSHDPTVRSLDNFDTENQRWDATLSRSRVADRYFLYGVLTTKIFCRPSCASRRPSRKHVRFFSFPGAIEAAEQASFRPCKRCKPETPGTGNTAVLAISQVVRRITAEVFGAQIKAEREGLKLESLAKSAGLSAFHFHRLFKATTQVTPAEFITACHALALQDYFCTYSSQGTKLNPCLVHLPPRWSQRTARNALGGISPEEYANGAKSRPLRSCRVSSPVGEIELVYSGDKDFSSLIVHATALLQDSSLPTAHHFRTPEKSEEYTKSFQQCVRELEDNCKDRDAELAADVLSVLWRARLWLKLSHDNGLR